MELQFVPVPLFDKYLSVEAYLIRYRIADRADGGGVSSVLQALGEMGVESFAGGRPVMAPISADMLPELAVRCPYPAGCIILLLEDVGALTDTHIREMQTLRGRKYRFAAMQDNRYIDNEQLVQLTDYVLLAPGAMASSDRRPHVIRYARENRQIQVVATAIDRQETFEDAKADGFHLYEGTFYRVPVSESGKGLNPIKTNLIQLLNLVRDENFEFTEITAVIRKDTALSYSLMRFINSPYVGIRNKVKSIQQAVTILGQIEVRKWVTASVLRLLGADRPDELTRLSLVRAKFAENLAPHFGLDAEAPGLFMTGLFSLLDAMLDCTMAEALDKVLVSDEIAGALLGEAESQFSPVLTYIVDYERADWDSVDARNAADTLSVEDVYGAYVRAMRWYNELVTTTVAEARGPQATRPVIRQDW